MAYVVASHWLMTAAPAFAVEPRARRRTAAGAAAALRLAARAARTRPRRGAWPWSLLAWLAWRDGGLAAGLLHLAPHLAVYAVLATVFALTLRRGREPLVTALVRRVHGHLTPGMAAYSRKVTVAWAICFAAIVADLDRPLRARALRAVGRVREFRHLAGDGAALPRRVRAALPPAPRVRTGLARRRAARLCAARPPARPAPDRDDRAPGRRRRGRRRVLRLSQRPADLAPSVRRRCGGARCAPAARRATMLNLSVDRYRFAVGLGAALLRGQTSLLPPNQTPHTLERLRASFGSVYALVEGDDAAHGLAIVRHDDGHAPLDGGAAAADRRRPRRRLRCSPPGSTGEPMPHGKPWGLLVAGARAAGQAPGTRHGPRLAGRRVARRHDAAAAHVRLRSRACCWPCTAAPRSMRRGRSIPADIAAALERAPAPRLLVTTPFHLKTLLDSGVALPRARSRPLRHGAACAPARGTRRGSVRWPPDRDLRLHRGRPGGDGGARPRDPNGKPSTAWRCAATATRSSSAAATCRRRRRSPTCWRVIEPGRFRLLGRSNDLVNIAGKRSSIAHLNFHLNAIDGVIDGSFWMPPDGAGDAGAAGRLRGRAGRRAGADPRRLAPAHRPGLPAAPHRRRRRAAARGDRQARRDAPGRAGGGTARVMRTPP